AGGNYIEVVRSRRQVIKAVVTMPTCDGEEPTLASFQTTWAEVTGDEYASLLSEPLNDLAQGDTIVLPKYSLGPAGSRHKLSVTVSTAAIGGASTTAYVEILVKPGALTAVIFGGKT
ncbi:unnamed protein product, partial [Chrysoparadoxa australica]